MVIPGAEIVSHGGDGHQTPPECLHKGPIVAGMASDLHIIMTRCVTTVSTLYSSFPFVV